MTHLRPGEQHLADTLRRHRRPTTPTIIDPASLLNTLCRHFDQEELETLCFCLGLTYDALRGDGRRAKTRELIAYYQRRDDLDTLIDAIRTQRPDVQL